MKKFFKLVKIISAISAIVAGWAFIAERKEEKKCKNVDDRHEPYGIYEQYIKRPLDAFLSTGALIVFSPILLITAILVKFRLGSPVIFTQERPGKIDPVTGKEKIFKLYKFRTMTDERDGEGNLMPDEVRLTSFGKKLRLTSLDELPELINIINGDMSIVGPRPQLVRDMVFMSESQRLRHIVRPGLSGLAQIKGRNAINWDEKLRWDLVYIKGISFIKDIKIILMTILKVFIKGETSEELEVTLDYGDELLKNEVISKDLYDELQSCAKKILMEYEKKEVDR